MCVLAQLTRNITMQLLVGQAVRILNNIISRRHLLHVRLGERAARVNCAEEPTACHFRVPTNKDHLANEALLVRLCGEWWAKVYDES